MNYSINKFFEPHECEDIINYMEENGVHFSYTKDMKSWYCKRVPNFEFVEYIKNRFIENYNNNKLKLWFPLEEFDIKDINVSLTKYYDGRWLELHKDQDSQLSTIVVLSEGFSDGRFLLTDSDKFRNGASQAVPKLGSVPSSKVYEVDKIHLNKGESLTFNGTELYHGVLPVTEGTRYSLNIWMTNTDVKFVRPLKNKSII